MTHLGFIHLLNSNLLNICFVVIIVPCGGAILGIRPGSYLQGVCSLVVDTEKQKSIKYNVTSSIQGISRDRT